MGQPIAPPGLVMLATQLGPGLSLWRPVPLHPITWMAGHGKTSGATEIWILEASDPCLETLEFQGTELIEVMIVEHL